MAQRGRNMPDALWKEEDSIGGRRVRAMVAILATVGCWWSRARGCTMCGYNMPEVRPITEEQLMGQLDHVAERYDGEEFVKIYTSGSFLDGREIPEPVRRRAYSMFDGAERLLVESRPEFVTPEAMEDAPSNLCVALGLESADDSVLRQNIRKGFTVSDHLGAVETLRERRIPIRTYLLMKPICMSERGAIDDVLRSVEFAAPYSEDISINPVNVQRGTLTERLWRRGEYRSPWLWSLVEALGRSKEITDVRVFSSPSGGGTQRGVHNCGECDRKVLEAVEGFSFTQDPKRFEGLDCQCRRAWEALTEAEELMGTSVDVERQLSDWTTY